MNDHKIIILSVKDLDVSQYISSLLKSNDNFTIAKKFTTNIDEYNDGEYELYLDLRTLNLAYKNNSFLYVTTNNYISHGITLDEYYSSNIINMNIEEFNLISNYILGDNYTVCWIDKSKVYNYKTLNLNEITIFENKLNKLKYLYFLNASEEEFNDIINRYLNGSEEEKNILLKEYS